MSGGIDPLQAGTNGTFGTGSGNGFGSIAGSYDDSTNLLNYTISFSDLTSAVSNMHFHIGASGVSGGVAVAVLGPWTSPEANSAILSAGNETSLLAGDLYVNIHTTTFGGGEIRGQVLATQVPEPSSAVFALVALSGLGLRRRRK